MHSLWVCPTHLQWAHTVHAHALCGWLWGRPAVRQLKHMCLPGGASGRAACAACSARCCSCLSRNRCGGAALPAAALACCCRGPGRAFLAPACCVFGPGVYANCPHGVTDACPRGPRVGANCRAPPYGYCPPFPEDAKRCALRAWRPPSVNGCPVAPPSEPVPVGFTNRRASSSPFTISGAIPTSGRSRRLRSTAIVSEWLWLAVCKIRSPLARIARKSVISSAKPLASALPSMASSTSRN